MSLSPGAVVAKRYTIERSIKSGGMGAVYHAIDAHLGTPCALKEMLDDFNDAAELSSIVRRFADEARFLATLNHPGIPRVRDYFTIGNVCYIAMDLIVGSNLEDELAERMGLLGEPFPPSLVVDDAIQVLDVLCYLHGLSPVVIHRDVKPANLIREFPSKRIKLVDFGLVRSLSGTVRTQTVVGTLSYASLEQLQGRAEPRSDIYALGATMFHLLTGQIPECLQIPHLTDVAPLIDKELSDVVERSVAPAPENRYADARAMRKALLDWQDRRNPGVRATEQANMPAPRTKAPEPAELAESSEPAESAESAEEKRTIPSARQLLPWAAAFLIVMALMMHWSSGRVAPRSDPPHVGLVPVAASSEPQRASEPSPSPEPQRASEPSPLSVRQDAMVPSPTSTGTSSAGPSTVSSSRVTGKGHPVARSFTPPHTSTVASSSAPTARPRITPTPPPHPPRGPSQTVAAPVFPPHPPRPREYVDPRYTLMIPPGYTELHPTKDVVHFVREEQVTCWVDVGFVALPPGTDVDTATASLLERLRIHVNVDEVTPGRTGVRAFTRDVGADHIRDVVFLRPDGTMMFVVEEHAPRELFDHYDGELAIFHHSFRPIP